MNQTKAHDGQDAPLDLAVRALDQLLMQYQPAPLPEVLQSHPGFLALHEKLAVLKEHAHYLSDGELYHDIPLKGFTAGCLRSLQAKMRHLAWQTERIAAGDFSQRLEFMGDFSTAFNTMAEALAKAQADCQESERRYRLLAENVLDVISTIDLDGRFTYVSSSLMRLLGYAQEDVLGHQINELLTTSSTRTLREALTRLKTNTTEASQGDVVELEFLRNDGSPVWTEMTVAVVSDETGKATGFIGVIRDITDRKRLRDELVFLATTDALTGASNRWHFMELCAQAMEQAARSNRPISLLFLDIDHFKRVNDTYGHATGDEVLRMLVRRGQDLLRTSDLFGRMGGEEFAVLLPGTGATDAYNVAERLRQAFERAQVTLEDGRTVSVTVSIGVAAFCGAKPSLDEALRRADCALYDAKHSGRNCVCVR